MPFSLTLKTGASQYAIFIRSPVNLFCFPTNFSYYHSDGIPTSSFGCKNNLEFGPFARRTCGGPPALTMRNNCGEIPAGWNLFYCKSLLRTVKIIILYAFQKFYHIFLLADYHRVAKTKNG
jgi:hypothetical protein